jgi:hypothetical protein
MAGLISKQLYGDTKPQDLTEEQKQTVSALSTLASGLAGAAVGGDAANAVAGAQGGRNAVENNFLGAQSQAQRDKAREAQLQNQYTVETARQLLMLERADQRSDELLKKYVVSPEKMSPEEFRTLTGYLQIYLSEQVRVYGEAQAQVALMQLLYSTQPLSYDYEYAGSSQARNAYGADWFSAREPSQNERLYREALQVARIGSAQEAMAKPGNEAIYLLGGGLGNTIRVLAAANGTAQASKGVEQGLEGDYWNAAGNILFGVLGIATIAVPGAKVPVLRAPDGTTAKVAAEGAKEAAKAVSPIVPGGGLAAHEAAGGHLIAKHVGQSEAQLLSRLSAEPKITGSSSFYDRTFAEKAVSQTLDMKQTEIASWLSGSANRLRLDHTLSSPVGISVTRGTSSAVDASSVRVILVRDSKMPTGYKILTGFPTVP